MVIRQFWAYRNPIPASAKTTPFIVPIQSEDLDYFDVVVCVPLSRSHRDLSHGFLFPKIDVEGEALTFTPLLIAGFPRRLLSTPVASLAHERHRIVNALDSIISGL